MDICSGEVARNVATAKKRIAALSQRGARLVLLPEMWSTGFAYEKLEGLSTTTPMVLGELAMWSRQWGMTIIGSMPEKKAGGIFNTAYVLDRGAVSACYRKVHLFSPTGEHHFFEPGRKAMVAKTSLGPIGLIICYDLRFPELCRSVTLQGARAVVVPAQWPAARVSHWDVLLRARAVENQVFVFGANRCGRDGERVYGGHSRIISPWGQVLARAGKRPANVFALIDLAQIESTRQEIPCLEERVPEAYG